MNLMSMFLRKCTCSDQFGCDYIWINTAKVLVLQKLQIDLFLIVSSQLRSVIVIPNCSNKCVCFSEVNNKIQFIFQSLLNKTE